MRKKETHFTGNTFWCQIILQELGSYNGVITLTKTPTLLSVRHAVVTLIAAGYHKEYFRGFVKKYEIHRLCGHMATMSEELNGLTRFGSNYPVLINCFTKYSATNEI